MNDLYPIRSGWREDRFIIRGLLTDKKIASYQKRGYYSAEYREARKILQEMRKARRLKRSGNFDQAEDGRLIYRP